MEFDLQCGKHKRRIQANNFEHAAKLFLLGIFEEETETDLKLGAVISVKCCVDHTIFDTGEALKDLKTKRQFEIYEGVQDEGD